MALVGRPQRLIPPHEPTEWIEVRELSGLELDDAKEILGDKVMARLGKMDSESLSNIRNSRTTDSAPAEGVEVHPSDAYDKRTLLGAILSWSYSEPLDEETRYKLDPETLQWLCDALVNLNVRPVTELFGSSQN